MKGVSLRDQVKVSNATATFFSLQELDRVWTNYLESSESVPKQDIKTLRKIAHEIDVLLVKSAKQFGTLPDVVRRNREASEARYEDILRDRSFPSEYREGFRREVERRGGLLALTTSANNTLRTNLGRERRNLKAKLKTITSGKFTSGDISKEHACSIAIGLAVGGALSGTGVGCGMLLAGVCD